MRHVVRSQRPSLPLFDPESLGVLPTKQLRAFYSDEGNSGSEWQEISVGQLKACALTGTPIRWSDGTFALPFERSLQQRCPTVCNSLPC